MIVYTDLDRLEQHMKKLSFADTWVIEEICNTARLFASYEIPGDKPRGLMVLPEYA